MLYVFLALLKEINFHCFAKCSNALTLQKHCALPIHRLWMNNLLFMCKVNCVKYRNNTKNNNNNHHAIIQSEVLWGSAKSSLNRWANDSLLTVNYNSIDLPKYLAYDPPEPSTVDKDVCLRLIFVKDKRFTRQSRVNVANVIVTSNGQRQVGKCLGSGRHLQQRHLQFD